MSGDWMWAAAGFALAAVVIGVVSVEIDHALSKWRRRELDSWSDLPIDDGK
jgi:hypothetical protein